jgi:hypothetical protein
MDIAGASATGTLTLGQSAGIDVATAGLGITNANVIIMPNTAGITVAAGGSINMANANSKITISTGTSGPTLDGGTGQNGGTFTFNGTGNNKLSIFNDMASGTPVPTVKAVALSGLALSDTARITIPGTSGADLTLQGVIVDLSATGPSIAITTVANATLKLGVSTDGAQYAAGIITARGGTSTAVVAGGSSSVTVTNAKTQNVTPFDGADSANVDAVIAKVGPGVSQQNTFGSGTVATIDEKDTFDNDTGKIKAVTGN